MVGRILATRPYRGNQYNLGRETFLQPVSWHDGWPVVLAHDERVPVVATRPALPHGRQHVPTTGPFSWTERFRASTLPLSWMTINVPQRPWYVTGKEGLRITPSSTPLGDYASGQPAYVVHRLEHHKATNLGQTPRMQLLRSSRPNARTSFPHRRTSGCGLLRRSLPYKCISRLRPQLHRNSARHRSNEKAAGCCVAPVSCRNGWALGPTQRTISQLFVETPQL